jgi:hypothetical protein
MSRVRHYSLALLALALVFAIRPIMHPAKGAGDSASMPHYYVIVFAYQDDANHLMKSHTFATFVKTTASGREDKLDPKNATVESFTISWLPADFENTLQLRLFRCAGRNYTLPETLAFAERLGTTVRHWGPIEIDEPIYQRALQQADRLNHGELGYKLNGATAVTRPYADTNVVNCIQAVSVFPQPADTGVSRGYEVSEFLAQQFAQHAKDSTPPAWLFDAVLRASEEPSAAATLARR